MNKKLLLIIGVIVVLGLIVYFTMGKNPSSDQTANNTPLADTNEVSSNQSLKDLLLEAKPMKCEFKDQASTGTFYMADQKMRGDVLVSTEGKTMTNHMIVVDKTSYTWVEGQKTGFKIAADETKTTETATTKPNNQQEPVNLEQKASYTCTPWSKDDSYFAMPAGVEFTDLRAMMPAVTPNMPADNGTNTSDVNNLKQAQCGACDSAPAASQAQCKAALGCK